MQPFSADAKGQLISKADWRTIHSPKKRTDKFVLFAFLLLTSNESDSSVHFLGESTAHQSAFWFYLTFTTLLKKIFFLPPKHKKMSSKVAHNSLGKA